MAILENARYRFVTDKSSGNFHIFIGEGYEWVLSNNQISIMGRLADGMPFSRKLNLKASNIPPTHLCPESLSLKFSGLEKDIGLAWEVAVILSDNGKMIQWKVSCQNNGQDALYLDNIYLLQPSEMLDENLIIRTDEENDLRFFANGWQSWSYSGTYSKYDRMRRSRLGFLQEPMVINPATPQYREKGRFSSDMFAALADPISGKGITLGFLSQKEQFGSITVDLRDDVILNVWAACDGVELDPGTSLGTDWFALTQINTLTSQPFDSFLEGAARENDVGEMQQLPAGWCSWYHYYQDISEEKILSNLRQVQNISDNTPLGLFQIDDGFQLQVGDWFSFSTTFPSGVQPLAEAISKAGMIPGIWLAPFIVHPRSRLAKEHPDWLLRKANGRLVRTGFGWNALGLALDLTVPAALDYACKVIHTAVHKWGFAYLKLDFLYSAALSGAYHDRTKTRAQVLRMGMRAVREAAGKDTILLGCGAPLGSMLGIVDMMRIGADVSGHWEPNIFGIEIPFKKEPCVPSVKNAIQNIVSRAMLHNQWWVNDPDCLLVREDTGLNLHEVRSLATVIAITGGSILVSDDMAALSTERLGILQSLLPPINQRPQILDWLEPGTPAKMRLDLHGAVGDWHLLSCANYSDHSQHVVLMPADYQLEDGCYLVSDFWGGTVSNTNPGMPLFEGMLAPHETVLFAVRSHNDGIVFAGSDLHISQGLEVKQLEIGNSRIKLVLDFGSILQGSIFLFQVSPPLSAKMGDKDIKWEQVAENIYRYYLNNQSPGLLEINI